MVWRDQMTTPQENEPDGNLEKVVESDNSTTSEEEEKQSSATQEGLQETEGEETLAEETAPLGVTQDSDNARTGHFKPDSPRESSKDGTSPPLLPRAIGSPVTASRGRVPRSQRRRETVPCRPWRELRPTYSTAERRHYRYPLTKNGCDLRRRRATHTQDG